MENHFKLQKKLARAMMLLVILMAWPMGSYAQEILDAGDWQIIVINDYCIELYRYEGKDVSVTTPTEFSLNNKTLPVNNIGDGCFMNNETLESVVVSDGIEYIGNDVFFRCKKLTSVTLPNSLTSIGKRTFSGCSQLPSITLPSQITAISDELFAACRRLYSVFFNGAVTSIGDKAFSQCESLETITLPNSVTSIGNEVFSNCGKLKAITLPDNVTSIGERAFYNTPLTSIILPSQLRTIAASTFEKCQSLEQVTITGNVTLIGQNAFKNCYKLQAITLPNSVTTIEDGTFYACTTLSEITIPSQVSIIGRETFYQCTKLKSVTFNGNITEIQESAFTGCVITTISLPYSCLNIGEGAFWGCNLENLYYAGPKSRWETMVGIGENAFWRQYPTVHWLCTVTFDLNGHGSGAPAAQTVYSSIANVLTVPTAPTAQGYDFDGWFTDAACTDAFDFGTELEDNITLYAKWTALENTITFDLGGRGTAIDAQTVYSGNTVPEPFVQFDGADGIEGWYTDAGRTQKYDFTTAVDHGFTLYAKWAAAGTATITTTTFAGGIVMLTNANGQAFNGQVMPGIYTLTVTLDNGCSFSGYYKLTNRSSHISDMDNAIAGSAPKTYALDLTEKDAVISVTFSSNPILTVTKRADDESVLNKVTWSAVNNQRPTTIYGNGSTIPYISDPNGAVASNFGIRLNVDLGSLSGYAFTATITDRGNGTTVYKNSNDGSSFLIQPYGSIDIDLYVYEKPAILLQDDADNKYKLAENMGIATFFTTLVGRTLYKDGRWNTLCLPFDVSSFSGTPLEGATVMYLYTKKNGGSGFDSTTGTLTLKFTNATSITAGKAYIVKWTKPADYDGNESSYDISNPTFTDVTISSTAPTASTSNDKKVSFVGCYSPVSISGNDRSIVLFDRDNTLYYPTTATSLNSCRAYFQLNGIGVGTEVSTYKLNFVDVEISGTFDSYGITTGIDDASHLIDNGQWTTDNAEWYNMNGQKMNGKPTKRGIYVNNGRKVVIK